MKNFGFWNCSTFVVIWQLISNHEQIKLKRFVSLFTLKLCNKLFFQLHLMLYTYVRRFDVMDTVWKFLRTKQGLLIIGSIHLACGDTFTRDTFSLSTTPAICHGYNHFSEEEDDSGGNCCGCISDASCGASSLLAACLAWFALRSTCLCVVVHWSGSWILVGILIILTLGFVCTDLEEGAVACGMCTSALT